MRVAVGAITRRRPQMFADLLTSFAAMRQPDGCEVVFVFAENDDTLTVADQVDAFRSETGARFLLGLEARPGIPMARNKVLDMALADGADLLTFVDDDEIVTRDWLVELVSGMRERALDLGGGPVRLTETSEEMTDWNRAVFRHLTYRAKKRNMARAESVAEGTDQLNNIYTNNWALRLDSQRRLGVRFDERLQVSGGSDTRFSLDMQAAGAKIGWIPDAWVEEPTPVKRLTLGYQYARTRDQALNAARLTRRSRIITMWMAVGPGLEVVLQVLLSPITGRYGLAKAAYKAGMAVGRFRGSFGVRSRHYDATAEHFHAEVEG